MFVFEHSQHLGSNPTTVRAFFSDVRQLNPNTPWFFRVDLLEGEVNVPLYVGQRFSYRFRLFGIPFPWVTEITEVGESHFVDQQRRGPYLSFFHRHVFAETTRGTIMRDTITYELRFGLFSPLANRLVVRPLLLGIFRYRARLAAQRFGEVAG